MGFFTLNRRLLPIKLHYGLFNAGTSTMQPAMPVYAKVLGFSSFVVGTIYTILPILGLFIKPSFGAIADKFKWHRGVLIAMEFIIMAVYFAIQFIPADKSVSTSISPNGWAACTSLDSESYFIATFNKKIYRCDLDDSICKQLNVTDFCTSHYSTYDSSPEETCFPLSNNTIADPTSFPECALREATDAQTYGQWQFWLFLVLLVFAWGGTSVVTTVSDTVCIEICGDANLYGKQRLWGSLGWGFLALVNGFVVDAVSTEGEEKNYTPAFYFMLVPMLFDILMTYNLKFSIPQQSENIAKDVWKVLLKPRNAIFCLWCGVFGIALALLWNFVFWLLEDLAIAAGPEINNNIKTIEGIVGFMQSALGEAPAFFLGGWVVEKIGHGHSLSVVFAIIGVRYTIYSFLVNPWWCIPVELLQNNFALFYSTMTSYAKKIGTPGTEATIQSILCAICEGVGVAIGSFLGGYFYDTYGGSITFRIFGIAFLVIACVNEGIEFIYRYLDRKEAEGQSKKSKASGEIPNETALDT